MRIKRINIFFLLLSLVGAFIIYRSTARFGVGISPDSVNYISCARELTGGNGFVSYDGTPMTLWPPLYPALLGVPALFGIDPVTGARILNILVFGLIVFCTGQLFRRSLRSEFLIITGTVLASFSSQVIYLSLMAWSELIFTLFCILFVGYLAKFSTDTKKKDFYIVSIIIALSCLQRYIGIVMVPTALAAILLSARIPLPERLKYSIKLIIISLIPLFIWLFRNYTLTSTISGPRITSSYSLQHNIARTFDVITSWIMPSLEPFNIRLIIAAIILLILFPAVIQTYYGKYGRTINIISIQAGYFLIYASFVVILSSVSSLDPIPYRYLAPVYIIFICLVFCILDISSEWLNEKLGIKYLGKYAVILLCLVWCSYSLNKTYTNVMLYVKNGAGYSSYSSKFSPILKDLKRNPLDGKIFSNAPDAVYILGGIKAEWIPRREEGIDKFKKNITKEGDKYIVWFNYVVGRTYLYNIREISNDIKLINKRHFQDGDIYLIESRHND
jgi:hypothetical protein